MTLVVGEHRKLYSHLVQFSELRKLKIEFLTAVNQARTAIARKKARELIPLLRSNTQIYQHLETSVRFVADNADKIIDVLSRVQGQLQQRLYKDTVAVFAAVRNASSLLEQGGLFSHEHLFHINQELLTALQQKDFKKAAQLIQQEEALLQAADKVIRPAIPQADELARHENTPLANPVRHLLTLSTPAIVRIAAVIILSFYLITAGCASMPSRPSPLPPPRKPVPGLLDGAQKAPSVGKILRKAKGNIRAAKKQPNKAIAFTYKGRVYGIAIFDPDVQPQSMERNAARQRAMAAAAHAFRSRKGATAGTFKGYVIIGTTSTLLGGTTILVVGPAH